MNNMSNNWCIIYLTSSSPAGFGALTFYLLNLQRSNKATEWRNICSLAK
jgi:hypothetical protein